MRYFLLEQDERITDVPQVKDFFQKIDVRHINSNTADMIPERTLIYIQPYEFTVFPDVLCYPALLFTQEVKDVIKAFDEYIPYRQIVYLDAENESVQLYFMPLLHHFNCLSKNSEYVNESRTAYSKVVLKRAAFRDKCLFQVKNKTHRLVVIRLDLVECLLARDFKGFTLTEVGIEL